jgi:hypothetical protein
MLTFLIDYGFLLNPFELKILISKMLLDFFQKLIYWYKWLKY